MQFLETTHKRKAAGITALLLGALIFAMLHMGLQYLDPPQEYGVAINFGNPERGDGPPVENTKTPPVVKETSEPVEEEEEVLPEETNQEVVKEPLVTQETEDAPVIEKPEEPQEEKPVVSEKKKEKEKVVPKPKPKPKPKPSKQTQDLLNNLLDTPSDTDAPKEEGDKKTPGIKGSLKGDPKATKYYVSTGTTGDKNYNLAGRDALSKPIEKPNCNEEGIVVVRIEVDTSGNVIRAIAGVKGSTNTAKCLMDPARSAALKTKWNADPNAPNKQKGTIVYRFSLSE